MQLLLEDFVGLQALISNNWENRNEDWVKLKSVEGVRWKQDWIQPCAYPILSYLFIYPYLSIYLPTYLSIYLIIHAPWHVCSTSAGYPGIVCWSQYVVVLFWGTMSSLQKFSGFKRCNAKSKLPNCDPRISVFPNFRSFFRESSLGSSTALRGEKVWNTLKREVPWNESSTEMQIGNFMQTINKHNKPCAKSRKLQTLTYS